MRIALGEVWRRIMYCFLYYMRVFFAALLFVVMPQLSNAAETTGTGAAVVTGEVTHLDDVALSGVVVALYDAERFPGDGCTTDSAAFLMQAITDDDGAFRFTTGYRGKAVVAANSDLYDFCTTSSLSVDSNTTAQVRLHFKPRSHFSTYVTDAGNAVSSATVLIYWTEAKSLRQRAARTGADGRAVFDDLPVAVLERIEVRSPAHQQFKSTEAIRLPAKDYPVWLRRKVSVEVEVRNPNPASETKAVGVSLLKIKKGEGEAGGEGDREVSHTHRRNAENGTAVFADVEPGRYKATSQFADAWAESDEFEVPADREVTRVVLSLEQNAQLEGRVLDESSRRPIADAVVTLVPSHVASGEFAARTARSDPDGKFAFQNVANGSMMLRAEHAEYSPHSQTVKLAGGKTVEVLLSAERPSLSGTVRFGKNPLPHTLVILYKAGEAEVPVATAMSGGDGQYDLGEQAPGNYVALVEAPVGSGEETSRKSYSVTLEDKPVQLDMTFNRPVQVRGRVQLKEGTVGSVREAKTLLFTSASGGAASRIVPLSADLSFEAELEPGRYAVGLEDRPGTEVEVPDMDDVEILLEL
jgi:hypothetical protein